VIAPRKQGEEYYVDHAGAELFIRSNDHGRNFRLVSAPVDDAQRSRWTELVPHRTDVMLAGIEAFADHLILRERHDARETYRSFDPAKGTSRPIPIADPVYALEDRRDRVWPNPDFKSRVFRFAYSGPAAPMAVYDEDLVTGARTLVKRDVVPGGFDASRYETEQIHLTARDGTPIPVSIVRPKGQKPDGTHPLFLRGYGAYGLSYDFEFDSNLMSLLDRGIACAIAHVRGGGEGGKPWHDSGRMQNKMNTFTDFIDAAEGLVKAGWSKPDALVIEGGSAGGLLMGAVTNMRPDLWRAVIARVPFVDVMNTMLDASLPLTTNEYEEWGDPRTPAEFDRMLAYSPYDNVAPKTYPPLLVETSYNDSQVMYWEPAKWVAKLRATKTDKNELLLKTNMKPAGHHGQSGRYDRMRERAFEYAWLLTQLGLATR
jgi:oligopeptidase B